MDEHTTGPWEFDGVCQITEVARPHMRVCFLPSDHHRYAASEANGCLIAAAPDMKAALIAVQEWFANFNGDVTLAGFPKDDVDAAVIKATDKREETR